MTREEAIKNFRQHWNAVADSDLYFCDKDEAGIDVYNLAGECFLCEYNKKNRDCYSCLIEWGTDFCINKNSPFKKWSKLVRQYNSRLLPSASKVFARRIANLPEKKINE